VITVGVIGAGTMGTGIAQVALEAGDEVVLHDVDPGAVERARVRIVAGMERRGAPVGATLDRIRHADTLDGVAAEADLVVEAALEDLALKQTIFRTLDAAAAAEVILATNTSALSVAAIAAVTARPDRVIGLHFFNPVVRMPLVEVVVTDLTAGPVVDRATAFVAAWGKTTVSCADTPGFIVNRVNRPFTIEALRMLEAGEADVEAIDRAMRGAGYPMGPFELMDLIGLDVNLAAATAVWTGLGEPDRLRPSPIQAELVAAGRLGRKRGAGFYRYDAGGPSQAEPAYVSPAARTGHLSSPSIVERIEAAIAAEATRAVADGVATPAAIALALRLGAGHPRSPFPGPVGGDEGAAAHVTIGS
jgi:3-hydroxybutyryl-CoA dehydrogenase